MGGSRKLDLSLSIYSEVASFVSLEPRINLFMSSHPQQGAHARMLDGDEAVVCFEIVFYGVRYAAFTVVGEGNRSVTALVPSLDSTTDFAVHNIRHAPAPGEFIELL